MFVRGDYCWIFQIKAIDLNTNECSTLIGSGKAGDVSGSDIDQLSGAVLSEPGGLSFDAGGRELYISDTNNHCVKIYNIATKTLERVSPSHS